MKITKRDDLCVKPSTSLHVPISKLQLRQGDCVPCVYGVYVYKEDCVN